MHRLLPVQFAFLPALAYADYRTYKTHPKQGEILAKVLAAVGPGHVLDERAGSGSSYRI